jgi:hypothetical protein
MYVFYVLFFLAGWGEMGKIWWVILRSFYFLIKLLILRKSKTHKIHNKKAFPIKAICSTKSPNQTQDFYFFLKR